MVFAYLSTPETVAHKFPNYFEQVAGGDGLLDTATTAGEVPWCTTTYNIRYIKLQ